MRSAIIVGLGMLMGLNEAGAQDPYRQPLKPRDFAVQATVLPRRAVGKTVLRAQPELAVEIHVRFEDFLPRGMEPTLLISGTPASVYSFVKGVEGNLTTVAFVVTKPELLREGAELSVQVGDDERTRARLPERLELSKIKPLSAEEAKKHGVPTLAEWLRRGK